MSGWLLKFLTHISCLSVCDTTIIGEILLRDVHPHSDCGKFWSNLSLAGDHHHTFWLRQPSLHPIIPHKPWFCCLFLWIPPTLQPPSRSAMSPHLLMINHHHHHHHHPSAPYVLSLIMYYIIDHNYQTPIFHEQFMINPINFCIHIPLNHGEIPSVMAKYH